MLKTPTLARISFLALLAPASANAQGWTEEAVARLAWERAPEVRAAAARAAIARGAVHGAGLLPNPSLAWERQEAFDPNAQAQDIITAQIPLDLSGRPGAQRALAEVDAALAEAEAEGARLAAVAQVLAAFYRAIATQRRVQILQGAQETLDEAARVMESRRAAGEASGYAASRLALEAELGRSRLAEGEALAAATRAGLGALLGVEAPPPLVGSLRVETTLSLDDALAGVAGRADVAALDEASGAARRANDAAGLAWLPRLSVEGGYNRVDGPVPGHGYAVGVAIEVPLFDHGQAERGRADAARGAVRELREATLARARARVRAAHGRLVALRAERARFGQATEGARALLLSAAGSGYREGERTLVELLDARRAAVDAAERELGLELAVRLADVRLRQAAGGLR